MSHVSEQQGVALLLVEQNVSLALDLCQRVLIMAKGALAADATAEEVAAKGEGYLDLLVI